MRPLLAGRRVNAPKVGALRDAIGVSIAAAGKVRSAGMGVDVKGGRAGRILVARGACRVVSTNEIWAPVLRSNVLDRSDER